MKTSFVTFLLLISAAAISAHAQTPAHHWSKRFGASGVQKGNAVAVDGSGNILLAGSLGGTFDLGGGLIANPVVARYNSAGTFLWGVSTTGFEVGTCVTSDPNDDVIVAGYFSGTIDLGGGPLSSAGGNDAFVAKFSGVDGSHLWSHRFGGTGEDRAWSLAVDNLGNVIIGGGFHGSIDFGGGALVSAGAYDIFAASFTPAGAHQWSQKFGSTADDVAWAIATDASRNVYAGGQFANTVDFGGGGLVSAGGPDMFLVKFDPAGGHLWSQRFGNTNLDILLALATDPLDNVVATGALRGAVDFGGGPLAGGADNTIFIARFASDGSHLWSAVYGDGAGNAVATDASGNIVVTGDLRGAANFGGGLLVWSGLDDVFLAKLGAAGNHQWSQNYSGTGDEIGHSVATTAMGNAVVTGEFWGTIDFGGGPLAAVSLSDVFLAEFGDPGPVPVLFSRFDATPTAGGVQVDWELWSDEGLEQFTLYRTAHNGPRAAAIASGDPRTTHSYFDTSAEPGETYDFALEIRTAEGNTFLSPTATVTVAALQTSIGPNYPNPFNPQTTIEYVLGEAAVVSIEIVDVSGAVVARLDQGMRAAGTHRMVWSGRDDTGRPVASGTYFYRLSGAGTAASGKMVLLK